MLNTYLIYANVLPKDIDILKAIKKMSSNYDNLRLYTILNQNLQDMMVYI